MGERRLVFDVAADHPSGVDVAMRYGSSSRSSAASAMNTPRTRPLEFRSSAVVKKSGGLDRAVRTRRKSISRPETLEIAPPPNWSRGTEGPREREFPGFDNRVLHSFSLVGLRPDIFAALSIRPYYRYHGSGWLET